MREGAGGRERDEVGHGWGLEWNMRVRFHLEHSARHKEGESSLTEQQEEEEIGSGRDEKPGRETEPNTNQIKHGLKGLWLANNQGKERSLLSDMAEMLTPTH